jgi:biotin synthase-related radical SAM superfamily protein
VQTVHDANVVTVMLMVIVRVSVRCKLSYIARATNSQPQISTVFFSGVLDLGLGSVHHHIPSGSDLGPGIK